jgi:hypothetical protein
MFLHLLVQPLFRLPIFRAFHFFDFHNFLLTHRSHPFITTTFKSVPVLNQLTRPASPNFARNSRPHACNSATFTGSITTTRFTFRGGIGTPTA